MGVFGVEKLVFAIEKEKERESLQFLCPCGHFLRTTERFACRLSWHGHGGILSPVVCTVCTTLPTRSLQLVPT